MRRFHEAFILAVLAVLFTGSVFADYLVVATSTGDVFKSAGRVANTSTNPTGVTTGGGNTVYWIQDGQLPADLLTSEFTPRYKYTTAGGWVTRISGDITTGDSQARGRKKTPNNEQCAAFTLPANQTAIRVDAPETLPDATFCIMVNVTSGVQTGFWRTSARDTSGVTITFTTNTNEITGVVMFHEGMH